MRLTEKACTINRDVSIILIHGSLISEYYCQRKRLNCTAVKNDVSAFKALVKSRAHTLLATNIFPAGALCASGLKRVYVRPLKDERYHLDTFSTWYSSNLRRSAARQIAMKKAGYKIVLLPLSHLTITQPSRMFPQWRWLPLSYCPLFLIILSRQVKHKIPCLNGFIIIK